MSKIVVFLLLAGFLNGNICAQAKQREALLKQIAALQVYSGYIQKGYSIAKKGLNTIGEFKKGELKLHTDYFTSLRKINPKIKNDARVVGIITLQQKIMKSYEIIYGQVQRDDLFHGDEVEYIKRVLERLMDNCDSILEELIAITTDDQLEMKEDERMKRIEVLHQNMVENHTFCESFSNQTRLMALSRAKDFKDIQTSRTMQGINSNLP